MIGGFMNRLKIDLTSKNMEHMTSYLYELTLLWLSIMKEKAWEKNVKAVGPHLPSYEWEKRLDDSCPTVNYCNI